MMLPIQPMPAIAYAPWRVVRIGKRAGPMGGSPGGGWRGRAWRLSPLPMGQGNQRTDLKLSRAVRDNMAAYDALPPPLRRWLADAKLQWSPASARRAWRRALWRSWGREARALELMDAMEAARLEEDGWVRTVREGEKP